MLKGTEQVWKINRKPNLEGFDEDVRKVIRAKNEAKSKCLIQPETTSLNITKKAKQLLKHAGKNKENIIIRECNKWKKTTAINNIESFSATSNNIENN